MAADFLARHSAIVALAAFAIVGVSVFADYGIGVDEYNQRKIGYASFNYIMGDEDALLTERVIRYYGVAFELPLIAVERLLRLEDSRDIHLTRHLLTHLFFLAGGFFAWLLAYRLFGSRLIALLAMLIFLLHPRIYAHSFFNTKDLPFLSAFMIALYLAHRAFRRDSVWAFALCGAGAGLLTNIRFIGVMLIPAVLGMLALDALLAISARRDRTARAKRALANAGAFAAASSATIYALAPLLWRDPLNLIEALETLAQHPHIIPTLFRSEVVQWPNAPWDFIPTWMLITTPPVALILAAVGIGCAARLCAADWRNAFANSTARFGLMALACLILPVAAVIALNSNVYDDWRQMYFLYAPLCVLAAFGLRWLAAIPKPRLRAAAFGLVALGIAAAAVQSVSLHPYQDEYFNALADKRGLAERWEMNYWETSFKEALETLLEMQPAGVVDVSEGPGWQARVDQNMNVIPKDDRRRLRVNLSFPSFIIFAGGGGESGYPVLWKREVYGVPIAAILDARAESAAAVRSLLAAARASEPAASAAGFDIYADGDEISFVKEGCGEEDERLRAYLFIFPVDQNDLPAGASAGGGEYQPLDYEFDLLRYGGIFDGNCVVRRDLPDYPISHVETGLFTPGESPSWSVQVPFGGYRERYARALAAAGASEPAASAGGFDVWADGTRIIYVKKDCDEEDARSRFALFAFPAAQSDLPQTMRNAGLEYERLDFDFSRYGMRLDGGCLAIRRLPEYSISHVETGQFTPGEDRLWSVHIPLGGYRERYERALASLSGEPVARSGFDIWLNDGALTYVKENCGEEDTRGRFFLSVFPSDPSDLSQDARDAGLEHESLNFEFARYGAILDGKCVIVRYLPDYPVSRIETGQWLPNEGELWSVRTVVGD